MCKLAFFQNPLTGHVDQFLLSPIFWDTHGGSGCRTRTKTEQIYRMPADPAADATTAAAPAQAAAAAFALPLPPSLPPPLLPPPLRCRCAAAAFCCLIVAFRSPSRERVLCKPPPQRRSPSLWVHSPSPQVGEGEARVYAAQCTATQSGFTIVVVTLGTGVQAQDSWFPIIVIMTILAIAISFIYSK